ncbi:MAG: hypothetical protein Q7J82_09885 [Coriobacteriia bacterium]|nr:hypothetical protein [Coriobacteriia bacterium]
MNGTGYPGTPQPMRNDPQYVAFLEQRIMALEARLPQTNIISPKFWTRAWAIYGHLLALSLIFAAIGTVIGIIITLIGGAALFSTISQVGGM